MSEGSFDLSLTDTLLIHLGQALEPVADLEYDLDDFAQVCGLDGLSGVDLDALKALAQDVSVAVEAVLNEPSEPDLAALLALPGAIAALIRKLSLLSSSSSTPEGALPAALGFFMGGYLRRQLPAVGALLALLGVIEDGGGGHEWELDDFDDAAGSAFS